jgi:hypothetical protein
VDVAAADVFCVSFFATAVCQHPDKDDTASFVTAGLCTLLRGIASQNCFARASKKTHAAKQICWQLLFWRIFRFDFCCQF